MELIILDGADNGHFGTIKINPENNIICGTDRYPRTKEKLWGYSKIIM